MRAVTAKDPRGRPLTRLAPKNFSLLEYGVSQDIIFFQFENPARSARPRTPGQSTAAAPTDTVNYHGRNLLLLYFELSEMSAADQQRAETAGREFIATHMAVQDLFAVITRDSQGTTLLTDFTNDRAKLLNTIANLPRRPEPTPLDDEEVRFSPDPDEFRIFNAELALADLESTATHLAAFSQRKTLVCFVTPRDLAFPANWPAEVEKELLTTIHAANGANVTIYPIVVQQPQNMSNSSSGILSRLAMDTGGAIQRNGESLTSQLARAKQAGDSYYLIGYWSTYTARDRVRQVQISLQGIDGNLTYQPSFVVR